MRVTLKSPHTLMVGDWVLGNFTLNTQLIEAMEIHEITWLPDRPIIRLLVSSGMRDEVYVEIDESQHTIVVMEKENEG